MKNSRRLTLVTGAAAVAQTSFKRSPAHSFSDSSNTNQRLITQLASFGSYHSNRWNKLIHFVAVPLLLWSSLVFLCCLEPSPDPPSSSISDLAGSSTISLTVIGLYSMYYLWYDFIVGLTWICCIAIPSWITAALFQSSVHQSWKCAFLVLVIAWFAQVYVGHGMFEKRHQPLKDALFQNLALGPLFVWYEFVFYCGFYRDLKFTVEQRIKHLLQQYNS